MLRLPERTIMSPRRARRSEILDIAAQLFARKGVATTTVRDIGNAANIYSGSLYHFFASKDVMVAEILATFMDDVQRTFGDAVERAESPRAAVRGLIGATLDVIDRHPHATAIYQNDRAYLRDRGLLEPIDAASRGIREFWMTALRQGVADGSFRDDVPAEVFYRSVRDTLWSTTHWPSRPTYRTDELAEIIWTMFFHGFGSADAAVPSKVSGTASP
jgi:TetR/AcrR family transcriptional regulator, cholesterol catabolism regulator